MIATNDAVAKLFCRFGGNGQCRIADPVPVRGLLSEWSNLVKNGDAEQPDRRIQRHAEPKAQRYRISHCSPVYCHFKSRHKLPHELARFIAPRIITSD
jgi:hypothetical protein